jgi:MoaA/NifB/PqqE/SkfB family radical SAM enzyme
MDNFFTRKGINLDISHRCSLECLRCQRTRYYTSKGKKVPGEDLSLTDFKKIMNHFHNLNFCGQYSDPVHHPKFLEILELTSKYKNEVTVHNASSSKSKDWYIKAFKSNRNARWVFGIDGLPEESCLYRVNQDGVKLFNIMLESKKYLIKKPVWQFIIFSYNENNIDKAKEIADKNDVVFMTLQSARWIDKNDPLIPKNKTYSFTPK